MTTVPDRSVDVTTPDAPERDPASDLGSRRITLEPWGVQVGPLSHLAAERDRLSRLEFDHLTVRRLGATLGAESTDGQMVELQPAQPVALGGQVGQRSDLDLSLIHISEPTRPY